MSWEDASFVIRSRLRKSVLTELRKPKTPTILARDLHTGIPNVSRTLKELQNAGLIQLITPKARIGKIFLTTDKGTKVLLKVEQLQ